MWILLPIIDLRCFVARQFLSQIYVLLSVKFPGLKMCECKKNDKYEVCCSISINWVNCDQLQILPAFLYQKGNCIWLYHMYFSWRRLNLQNVSSRMMKQFWFSLEVQIISEKCLQNVVGKEKFLQEGIFHWCSLRCQPSDKFANFFICVCFCIFYLFLYLFYLYLYLYVKRPKT